MFIHGLVVLDGEPIWRGALSMGCGRAAQLWPSLPPAAVCADNHPDQLRGPLAVHVPSWVALLPDRIHDLSDHSLHKLLRSGKSHSSVAVGTRGLSSKGPPLFV